MAGFVRAGARRKFGLVKAEASRLDKSGQNRRTEVESCFPLSRLHLRRARVARSNGPHARSLMLAVDPHRGQCILSLVACNVVIDRVVAHHAGS
jgi:hypothetical protein